MGFHVLYRKFLHCQYPEISHGIYAIVRWSTKKEQVQQIIKEKVEQERKSWTAEERRKKVRPHQHGLNVVTVNLTCSAGNVIPLGVRPINTSHNGCVCLTASNIIYAYSVKTDIPYLQETTLFV
ncbi:uncharacterized protein HKW66_Vig0191180 [Vigna angularis]|uniref:Uncharacterized protein n=1 Tax=Phaseolus angularis TaxID=3914 RepID=A0A8T0KVK5_PHAAN|nr:uncharacterized protein HKW66_Vig0191180 [Vigna angularis]